ncbi:MAG TPA: hypothetical protein VGM25_03705 [Caulobacteraceae bacterium]
MQTIEVGDALSSEPGFDTPDEAIQYAKGRANRTQRGEDVTPYVGQSITSVDWRDDALWLGLASGATLQFEIVEHKVDLTIIEVNGGSQRSASTMHDVVALIFRNETSIWKRAQMMESLLGNEFHRVQLSGSMFNFLYMRNVGILHLSVLLNRQTNRPFLFWCPSD